MIYLEVHVRSDKKLVEIWLNREEKNDLTLRMSLEQIYKKYRQKKYLVAVFESGNDNLYQNTLNLLVYNRNHSIQQATLHEKHLLVFPS